MKVLAVYEESSHRGGRQQASELELAILNLCIECDPQKSSFVGVESGLEAATVKVIERPDINFQSYRDLVNAASRRHLHLDDLEPRAVSRFISQHASVLLQGALQHRVGALIARQDGQLIKAKSPRQRRAPAKKAS